MNIPRILLSLTSDKNDYQQEQAREAQEAASRLGVELSLIYADNDAIAQSQQLLSAIQSKGSRPDAVIFEPAGTGLATVARAAATAGIGWVVLNRDVDYLSELRGISKAPIFALSSDHVEVGRIQGRQLAALLPQGGSVLHIQGPVSHSAAQQRTQGAEQTKPHSVLLRSLKGQWTEKSGYDAIASWLRLSTSHETTVCAVVAHNDDMAIGARKAFQELATGDERSRWLSMPFLGCDGLPKTGKAYVDKHMLQATVHIPANAGKAMQMLVQAMRTGQNPPERTLTVPESYPPLDKLSASAIR